MSERAAYLCDGTAIYERSFAIIRAEADLSSFSAEEADIAVRMIHACGQVEVAQHIVFGGDVVAAARRALAAGAPIFCDAEMVAHGVTRARLPAKNDVVCTLNDPRTPALAADPRGVPFIIVRGRMGGSAITAAAINALARAGL